MKYQKPLRYALAIVTLASGIVYGLQDPAPDPGNGASWTTDTGDIQNIVAQNAAGAPGNPNGTYYWFAATDSQSNTSYPSASTIPGGCPTTSSICESFNGNTRISGAPGTAAGNSFNETVPGSIPQTLANTPYNVYAQACPNGVGSNSSGCSNWIRLNTGGIQTKALPAAPFITPTKPDVGIDSITVKAGIADPGNVQFWHLQLKDVDGGGTVTDLGTRSFADVASPQTVAIAPGGPGGGYNQTLAPNHHYQYLGQVVYYWDQPTPATPAVGDFTTTPVDPGPIISTPTHFTVTAGFNSNNGGVDNPVNTKYLMTLTGPTPTQTFTIAYTGSNPMSHKFTNLEANQPYQVCVQAQNNDPSWNPSHSICQNFNTLDLNPTYTVTGVQTNQATFNVTLNPAGGITNYIVERCVGGVNGTCVQDTENVWSGTSISDTMGSLTPNTAYEFYIEFLEGTDPSAFSPQPDQGQAINQFTTTPVAPTGGSLTVTGANSITGNFTDPSTNPNGSTYEMQVCLAANFLSGCQPSVTGPKVAGTNQSLPINTLSPSTTYYAQVRTQNVTRPTWPDSGWTSLGSTTTLALISQTASFSPTLPNRVTGTLSVQVNNNSSAPGFTYSWAVTTPAGVPALAAGDICPSVNGTATGNSCLVTFHQIGTGYSATVTITDSLNRTYTSNVTFNVLPVPLSVSVTPASITVSQGGSAVVFTSTATDQFNNSISPVTGVTWTTPGGNGGNGFTPSGATVSFNPNGTAGTYNIHASVAMNGVTQADTTDATITVQQAAGTVTIEDSSGGPAVTSLNQAQPPITYKAVVTDLSSHHISNPTVVWSFVGSPQLVAGDPSNLLGSQAFDSNGDSTIQLTPNNPGSYTIQAVASGVATGTLSINIHVVAGSIVISPSPKSVITGNVPPQTFTSTVSDPFGFVLSNAEVTWVISGGGTLSTAGPSSATNFSATTPGSFTLTASSVTTAGNTVTANDAVTVLPAGPIFDSLVFNATSNKAGTITATAHDNAATQPLQHSWTPSDPSVTFTPSSQNGPSGSPVTTSVVFTKAGQFTLTDMITDQFGATASSSTVVVVSPVLSDISICPAGVKTCPTSITVQTFQDEQFVANEFDQFGNPMTPGSLQWTETAGTLNASGASASFSASTIGVAVEVKATDPTTGRFGSITVNLVSFDVSGAFAYPVPYKANQGNGVIHFTGLGSLSTIHIYTSSGRRVFDTTVSSADGKYDWPIVNSSGENVASGVYFYVIQSSSGKKDGKLIIIK